MNKIKVIIKRPDEEFGHVCNISTRLENLQKTVGGFIRVFPINGKVLGICNEEGKIQGLPENFGFYSDKIRGTVIICGWNGDEFADVPISLKEWRTILNEWEGRK